jgi:hypothetical protein
MPGAHLHLTRGVCHSPHLAREGARMVEFLAAVFLVLIGLMALAVLMVCAWLAVGAWMSRGRRAHGRERRTP